MSFLLQRISTSLVRQSILCSLALFLFGGMSAQATSGSKNLADILELRGYTRIGGVLEFSIFNKEQKRSEWLRVNEEQFGYKIERYDPDTNTIYLRYQGQSGKLHLQASRIADYVEPSPGNEASTAPSPAGTAAHNNREAQRATASAATSSPNIPNRRQRGGAAPRQPPVEFVSRSGSSAPSPGSPANPANPGGPSNPSNPGAGAPPPDGGENNQELSYWERMSSPPPLPPTSPPGYSPEQ